MLIISRLRLLLKSKHDHPQGNSRNLHTRPPLRELHRPPPRSPLPFLTPHPRLPLVLHHRSTTYTPHSRTHLQLPPQTQSSCFQETSASALQSEQQLSEWFDHQKRLVANLQTSHSPSSRQHHRKPQEKTMSSQVDRPQLQDSRLDDRHPRENRRM